MIDRLKGDISTVHNPVQNWALRCSPILQFIFGKKCKFVVLWTVCHPDHHTLAWLLVEGIFESFDLLKFLVWEASLFLFQQLDQTKEEEELDQTNYDCIRR